MGPMDDTPDPRASDDERDSIEALQARLEAADPADAPEIADELAARLADLLDDGNHP